MMYRCWHGLLASHQLAVLARHDNQQKLYQGLVEETCYGCPASLKSVATSARMMYVVYFATAAIIRLNLAHRCVVNVVSALLRSQNAIIKRCSQSRRPSKVLETCCVVCASALVPSSIVAMPLLLSSMPASFRC